MRAVWIGILLMVFGIGISIFAVSLIVSYLFVMPNRSTYEETFFSGLKYGEISNDVFESHDKEELFLTAGMDAGCMRCFFPFKRAGKSSSFPTASSGRCLEGINTSSCSSPSATMFCFATAGATD